MGVSPIDCEKIMENVCVLRQTLQVTGSSINSYSQQYDSLVSNIPPMQERN